MSWLDKLNAKKVDETQIPKELEGMSPEQIVVALKENTDLKARMTTVEAERAAEKEEVGKINTEFQSIKERLAAVDAAKSRAENRPEELANFVEEPDKAFEQRATPLTNLTIASAFMTARMLAQQELDNMDLASPVGTKTIDGRLFRAWTQEIDSEAKKYPQSSMIHPRAWLGIFYYVKGLHSDELSNPDIRKKKYNFLEPGTSSVPPAGGEKKEEGVESLTAEELRVAERMHVTPENYLKRKRAMKFTAA